MVRKLVGLALALALTGTIPAAALGQGITIEPYVGIYVPGTDLVDDPDLDITARQKEGLALGGRLGLGAGLIGLEGNFVYVISDGELQEGGLEASESAGVWIGDARVRLNLLPGPIGLHATGGIALIGRTGDAYDDVQEGKTDVGGALGLGARIGLGSVAIRGDIDGYIYSAALTANDIEFESQTQVDFVLSAGLQISLGS